MEKIANWISTCGLPVVLVLNAVIVGYIVQNASATGKIEARIEGVVDTLSEHKNLYKERFDQLASNDQGISNQLSGLSRRMYEKETDPLDLLKRHGITVEGELVTAYVDSRVVIFAKTGQDETRLSSAGYRKESLTPYLSGFVHPASLPKGAIMTVPSELFLNPNGPKKDYFLRNDGAATITVPLLKQGQPNLQ